MPNSARSSVTRSATKMAPPHGDLSIDCRRLANNEIHHNNRRNLAQTSYLMRIVRGNDHEEEEKIPAKTKTMLSDQAMNENPMKDPTRKYKAELTRMINSLEMYGMITYDQY